jgi:cysteine-rich repeat protein
MKPLKLFLLALLLFPSFAGAEFDDVKGHRFEWQILSFYSRGIVRGYPDGTFRPDQPINRAELLKILMVAALGDAALSGDPVQCFTDFTPPAQWFWASACAAKERGIVSGYPDGTFRGEVQVNLAEALKMTLRAWNLPLPQYFRVPDHWYDPYIDAASAEGVFTVLPRDPAHLLTRAEMAALLTAFDVPLQTVSIPKPRWKTEEEQKVIRTRCGDGFVAGEEECDDGNLQNGDGCSSMCILVPEPLRHGALQLNQRSMAATSVSPGADDVVLLRFSAAAGRQDVLLRSLVFVAASGSLYDLRDYALYADSNNDGVLERVAADAKSTSTSLTFSRMQVLIPEGHEISFELRGDIVEDPVFGTFSLSFATGNAAYVIAEGLADGRTLTGITTDNVECPSTYSICWITVFTATPRLISMREPGNLYVTGAVSPIRSRFLQLGKTTGPVFGFVLRAEREDIAVTSLSVGGGAASVEALEVYVGSPPVRIGIAREAQCDTIVTGIYCLHLTEGDFIVGSDDEVPVTVYARMKGRQQGGESGQTPAFNLTAAVTGNVAVKALGRASDAVLAQNDGNNLAEGEVFVGRNTPGANAPVTGSTHDTAGMVLASVANASNDPEGAAVPSGTGPIGVFRFTSSASSGAGALYAVSIHDLSFTIAAINVLLDAASFVLINTADPSVQVSCSASAPTGVITVTCSDLELSNVRTVIPDGGSINLALRATVTNPQTAGSSSLQVSLQNLGSRADLGGVRWSDAATVFQWVDIPQSSVRSTLYRSE